MKKGFFKVLAVILISSVILTGCVTLISTSYKEFSHVETDLSVWGFYGHIDKGRQNIISEYEDLRGTSKRGYDELYDYFDNKKPLYDILRIGATALDLKIEMGQEAYYDFKDMKNFVIRKDAGSGERFTINFKQPVLYNNSDLNEILVDHVLEKIYFDYEIKIAVRAIDSSSKDMSNISIISYNVSAPKAEDILAVREEFLPDDVFGNDRETRYTLQEADGENYFEITASKFEKENGEEVFRYEKTIRLTNNTDIKVSRNFFEGSSQTTIEKKLPAQNSVRGFEMTFNKLEGHFGWKISYDFGGEIVFSGESYFQGDKKFLVKEMFDVVTPKAMNFESSVINEIKIDDNDFAFKMIKASRFESLKSQNILKVGVYDNEPNAYLLSKDKTLQVAVFRKYG